MKQFNIISLFCFSVLLLFKNCNTNEQSKKEIVLENQSVNEQITLIQNALDSLVKSIYSGIAVQTDTASTVIRLDSIPENERDAATIKFRLGVIEESIKNISKVVTNKTLSNTNCHWKIVGYSSCNCHHNPGGTIHCDLCPIKKWVCD